MSLHRVLAPSLQTPKSDDSKPQCLASLDGLQWLDPLGISFDDTFCPTIKGTLRQIEQNISNYISSLPKSQVDDLCHSLSSYFLDIYIVSQFTQPTNVNTSFLKIILNIYILQEAVISALGQFFSMTFLEDNLVKLRTITLAITRDLSFLKCISNEKALTDMLFDAISNCHHSIKEILLDSLFLLIDGSSEVIDRLLKLILENNDDNIISSILQAIEGLTLSPADKERVRQHVLTNILPAATTRELPAVIKFLVSTTDETNAAITVDSFRSNLFIVSPSHLHNENFNEQLSSGTNSLSQNETSSSFPKQSRKKRKRMTVNKITAENLTFADTEFFILLQLKNALQFNHSFNKNFIIALEFSSGEFCTLDVWVLFCLFSISPMRARAQQMITKMSGKTLTSNSITNAVLGHQKALENLSNSMIDLMSWMISNTSENVANNGIALASALFEENENSGTLQDIVGALLIQIEIGEESNKARIVSILELLSLEHPEKLRNFVQLIQGLLWGSESITNSLYSIIASITARLTLRSLDDFEEQASAQITIGFNKMMSSTHSELRELGVIGSAAILNRINEISGDEMDNIVKVYSQIMNFICDDIKSSLIFNRCLLRNRNRTNNFNIYLIDELEKRFQELIIEDEGTGQFGLESSKHSFNLIQYLFSDSIKTTFPSRKAYERRRLAVVIFSSTALQLLLDAHKKIGNSLREKCFYIFETSFTLSNDDRKDEECLTILLFVHSYLMCLLNYFCDEIIHNKSNKHATENGDFPGKCIQRASQLISIEEKIVLTLRSIDNFEHDIYGKMFPKHKPFLKKYKDANDVNCIFIEKYRIYFSSPSSTFFSLIYSLPLPLSDNHLKIAFRIIIDYMYCLQAKNGPIYEVDLYESLDFIHFLCMKLLPTLMRDERSTSILILERIFKLLKIEFTLPQYKDKNQFDRLLKSCSGNDSGRSNVFKKFAKIMVNYPDLPQTIQLPLLLLLRSILHNGPSQKVDICGNEAKCLCKLAKKMLTCKTPILSKSGVQSILPIFFEHNKRVINHVSTFVTVVFPQDILAGNRCEDWPSLIPETFSLYFNQCFLALNMKLNEAKKKILSNSFIISENLIEAVMNRLNKLAALTKGLLLHTCAEKVPVCVIRVTIRHGVNWLDNVTGLFPFLCDSRDYNFEAFDEFLTLSAAIARQLQSVVDHVRRNEKSLQSLLPGISKSLATWSYALKSSLRSVQEEAELLPAKERTLVGEVIRTQQIEQSLG
ncbi:hypothetical protein TRFO_18689 [Tritrichomonas foetus]|uniref:Uncharacterized protein n=1 Tax=Tritrichomonas foetus TaxID=1144522 RepID=A0A1J4KKG9_9EUKA|nr:hypothetical protein TRFO_18689 [Tritrichomonas foetus]|eukprot:OHT11791.1 hypothetical protein TRFO_18689 [Tritrichomonas foetus]